MPRSVGCFPCYSLGISLSFGNTASEKLALNRQTQGANGMDCLTNTWLASVFAHTGGCCGSKHHRRVAQNGRQNRLVAEGGTSTMVKACGVARRHDMTCAERELHHHCSLLPATGHMQGSSCSTGAKANAHKPGAAPPSNSKVVRCTSCSCNPRYKFCIRADNASTLSPFAGCA